MGDTKRYEVTEVDGREVPGGTILNLDDETAERMGLLKKPSKKPAAEQPAKAEAAPGDKKRRAPAGRRPRQS